MNHTIEIELDIFKPDIPEDLNRDLCIQLITDYFNKMYSSDYYKNFKIEKLEQRNNYSNPTYHRQIPALISITLIGIFSNQS